MHYQSIFRPGLFAGQTIIVTGGGSGIGRAAAHELATLGAHVVRAGRTPDKLARVHNEITAAGGSAKSVVCHVRDEAQVVALFDRVLAERSAVHGLFNT